MKALLVTSRVTFVPDNYDMLITRLAASPQIGGLLVLDNRDGTLLRKAMPLGLIGARGLAFHLFRNYFGDSDARRRRAFEAQGKPVWMLQTINCPSAVRLVTDHAFDLLLNARTRFIYSKEILGAPALGCLNVHHGLLPEQRGAMCDLWALHERGRAGFSIHQMIPAVDAGHIVSRVEMSAPGELDYIEYLRRSGARELEEITSVLKRIEKDGRIAGTPNLAPTDVVMRRNPTARQIRAMRRGGVRL